MGLQDRDWYWKQVDRLEQKPSRQVSPPIQRPVQRSTSPLDDLLRKPSTRGQRESVTEMSFPTAGSTSSSASVLPAVLLIVVFIAIAAAGAWVFHHPDVLQDLGAWWRGLSVDNFYLSGPDGSSSTVRNSHW